MNSSVSAFTPAGATVPAKPDQRLARHYRFHDADMDLFFMAAMGWGPAGGLDIGQALYVADNIIDGNAASWVHAFSAYGELQEEQAQAWRERGWIREAGEARLKAFASYRSAWQFAEPGGEVFLSLYGRHHAAFVQALEELGVAATFFEVPYAGRFLPGVFLPNENPQAPVVLIIGGADTCFEDLFLTLGRNLMSRGYAVALADLPGQGMTSVAGLHWEAEAEKPIAVVIDTLVSRFQAQPGRMALIGLSLGGYFVARAAGCDTRLATVIASTPFPNPGELFRLTVEAQMRGGGDETSSAAQISRQFAAWKTGARNPQDFIELSRPMVADPSAVTLPFLSILGAGDSPVFAAQAQAWHRDIPSQKKAFVRLDAASGADGHVQVNNRLRLAQECSGWMREVFGGER